VNFKAPSGKALKPVAMCHSLLSHDGPGIKNQIIF